VTASRQIRSIDEDDGGDEGGGGGGVDAGGKMGVFIASASSVRITSLRVGRLEKCSIGGPMDTSILHAYEKQTSCLNTWNRAHSSLPLSAKLCANACRASVLMQSMFSRQRSS
jgi:hypothetical protein